MGLILILMYHWIPKFMPGNRKYPLNFTGAL